MRGFLFLTVHLALFPGNVQGTEPEGTVEKIDSTVVLSSRAGKSTPVTYSMVTHEELQGANPINSLPMNLSLQPSVIAVNEGGTGLGYSKMTVRGVKGSQINVTLNGITLNDAESQEVFWVNMPALSAVLSNVQLQRGLGTSASGPGAFGASINMSTLSVGSDPYASVDLGYGSYGTFTSTAAAGTGLTRSGLYFDFAFSKGITDGYIRNAYADVQSAYATLGWMDGKNSLRLSWLYGDQHTGITWNGITLEQYEADRRYNPAGEYTDSYGNTRYYDNETDNYTQHHLQLNYTRQFDPGILWSTTFNWTKGYGYFENYRTPGFKADLTGDSITREALDNHYFVLNSDVRYTSEDLIVTGGINLSSYNGGHIGELRWNQALGDEYDYSSYHWYFNKGIKREANLFARAEYSPLKWMTVYADLQYRGIWLEMSGPEDDQIPLDYSTDWQFFNPRAGVTFRWDTNHKAYASAAMGHREPGRTDIKENIKNAYYASQQGVDEPVGLRPEKMVDIEVGYSYVAPRFVASVNLYMMEYWDMLLETGRLSNVGYAIKENVDRAWRRGVEAAVAWEALPWLKAEGNITLSSNVIRNYTEFVQHIDTYDNWANTGRVTAFDYGNTKMLMSPAVSGMARLSFSPWKAVAKGSLKTTTLSVDGKYVGKQYLDNTMTDERSIPDYFVANLSLSHTFAFRRPEASSLTLSFYINNLFNNMYYADGWCWKNIVEEDGNTLTGGIGIYPQPPLNCMFRASLRF